MMQRKTDITRKKLYKSRKKILALALAAVMFSDISMPVYADRSKSVTSLPQEQETISGNATGYTDLDFELPESGKMGSRHFRWKRIGQERFQKMRYLLFTVRMRQ